MVRRSRIFLTLALLGLLLCAGCETPVTEQSYDYTYTEVYLRAMEPYGTGFILSGTVPRTVVGGHTYEFEASIPEAERDEFVALQEVLCAHLAEKGISTEGMTFRVLTDYPNRAESENGLAYFDMTSRGSWAQALTTLQAALGDYTNYGYLYALSNHAAGELGWAEDQGAGADAGAAVSSPALLNLVYPCFDEAYTEAADISACKTLAVALLSGLEDPYGGEEFFLSVLADHMTGQDAALAPTHIVFAYNGQSCPLKLRTRYLEVFRDGTYVASDLFERGYIPQDYFSTVDTILDTFEGLDGNLEEYRALLGVDGGGVIPVRMMDILPRRMNVYFEEGGVCSWTETGCEIFATEVGVLDHEYIHYLYWLRGGHEDPEKESWHTEALSYYYGSLTYQFELRQLYAAHDGGASLEGIEALIGHAYTQPADEILFARKVLVQGDQTLLYYLKTEFVGCIPFGDYFIREYGETAFIESMIAPSKTEQYTGVSLDQIVEDWCGDMTGEEN